jgi:hypothetical protein
VISESRSTTTSSSLPTNSSSYSYSSPSSSSPLLPATAVTVLDTTLKFKQLKQLESYIDEYAFFNGFQWKVGRTKIITVSESTFFTHFDNISSSYRSRACTASSYSRLEMLRSEVRLSTKAEDCGDSKNQSTPDNASTNEDYASDDGICNDRENFSSIEDIDTMGATMISSTVASNAQQRPVAPARTQPSPVVPAQTPAFPVDASLVDIIIHRTFLCDRAGKSPTNTSAIRQSKQKRTMCSAHLNTSYSLSHHTWGLNTAVLEHNHPVILPQVNNFKPTIRFSHQLTDEHIHYLREQWSGNVRNPSLRDNFLKKFNLNSIDGSVLRNLVARLRNEVGGGSPNETNMLFKWIYQQKNCFTDFETDDFNRFTSIFYMSQHQIEFMKMWPEVLIIDATYKTNRFNHQLVLITIVDDENRSQCIASALIEREDGEFYSWIFACLRRAVGQETMDRVACVVTDGERAFPIALERQLPGVKHVLCAWHIKENVKKQIKRDYSDAKEAETVQSLFNVLIERVDSEDAFLVAWDTLLNTVSDKPRLQQYFIDQHLPLVRKWAKCYTGQYFNLGITTTSRNEGMNHIMKAKLDRGTSLLQLFQFIDQAIHNQHMKRMELIIKATTRRSNTRSSISSIGKKLHDVVSNYAATIIEAAITECSEYVAERLPGDALPDPLAPCKYRVSRMLFETAFRVCTVPENDLPTCSCNRPAQYGLPCVHTLTVHSKVLNIVPFQLYQVHNRWRLTNRDINHTLLIAQAEHKEGDFEAEVFSNSISRAEPDDSKSRWSILAGYSKKLCEIGAVSRDSFVYARAGLQRAIEEVMYLNSSTQSRINMQLSIDNSQTDLSSEPALSQRAQRPIPFNPAHVTNINNPGEVAPSTMRKRKYRCSNCRSLGHYSNRCTAPNQVTSTEALSNPVPPSDALPYPLSPTDTLSNPLDLT